MCFMFLLITATADNSIAQVKNVEAEGEAVIVKNDVPSAKQEAIARAKWTAIEQVVGVQIKAESFVQNMTLVDDAIKTQVAGVVKKFKVLDKEKQEDIYWVKIRAWVEPTKAKEAVSALALNNSIAVFIPARKPRADRRRDEYDETNIFSETLIEELTNQDYKVIDVAPTHVEDAAVIERAAQGGRTLTMRSLMYKFLSNILIIGKIDYAISTRKGENIGYGKMPFNHVTVRLTYRMVAKNNKTGNIEILTAGTERGKGLAINVEDAAAKGLEDITERLVPKILDKVSRFIQGNVKKIRVKIAGVKDLDTNMEIKDIFQNIIWVTNVKEKGMGEFVVSYPENTLYLANSIKQKGNFKIIKFSPYSITLEYL